MGRWLLTCIQWIRQTAVICPTQHTNICHICYNEPVHPQWGLLHSTHQSSRVVLSQPRKRSVKHHTRMQSYCIPNTTDMSTLDFVYEGTKSVDDLPRTLIFVNKVLDSQLVWRRSQEILPTHLWQSVDYLNAWQSSQSKKLVLQCFQEGQTRVLIIMEIGSMVRWHLYHHQQW